jgi:dihydroxy-acid dehydratase
LRLSDARMSGTAFGAIVLHISPEAAAGGPLGLVQTGDRLRISVAERRLDLLVSEAELAARPRTAPRGDKHFTRGWRGLHQRHVLQAEKGCDFDFLLPEAP